MSSFAAVACQRDLPVEAPLPLPVSVARPVPVGPPRAAPRVEAPSWPPVQPPIPHMRRGGPQLALAARVKTGNLPKSVQLSPDGEHVYVCNFGWKGHDNVWRYDAHTLARDGEVHFEGNAVETLFTRDSKTLFVSSFSGARVYEVDADSLVVRRRFRVGANPKVMALSPDEKLLYVANWSINSISVVDLERGHTIQQLRTGAHPRGMSVREDGTLFVNAMYAHNIHVFGPTESGAKRKQLRLFESCEYPRHSLLVPDHSLLFISCSGTNSLDWYDPDTGLRQGQASVGENPRSLAMSSSGRFFAVANFDAGSVSLVDTHLGTFDTFEAPEADKVVGVAIAPGPGLTRVYLTSWRSHELLVFEPEGPVPLSSIRAHSL